MITRTMTKVMVDNLADDLMEAEMMIRKTRMRLEVAIRTRGETIKIISMIKIIKIREEEEEGKELEEEASVENISIVMKKGIDHLNVLNAKEGMIEETTGRVELQLLMKIQGHHTLKMLKKEKS